MPVLIFGSIWTFWDTIPVPTKAYHRTEMLKQNILLSSKRIFHTSTIVLNHTKDKSIITKLDLLGDSKPPLNNINKCTKKGIIFDSGVIVAPGKVCLLISNRVLEFQPKYSIKNNIMIEFDETSLNFLKMINPLPELMILGLGSRMRLLSDANLRVFRDLGTKVEITDTRNACRNFDLLATERPNQIGALLLPLNV